jgi:hypothetical protein
MGPLVAAGIVYLVFCAAFESVFDYYDNQKIEKLIAQLRKQSSKKVSPCCEKKKDGKTTASPHPIAANDSENTSTPSDMPSLPVHH